MLSKAVKHTLLYTLLTALSFSPCSASVTLDLHIEAPSNLEVFFLEDLNISGLSPSAIVFSATIVSDIPVPNAIFIFSMYNSSGEIIRGESHKFLLPQGMLHLTNLDLTEESSPYQLDDYDISSSAENIKQQLMQTGYFPSGTYTLKLELYQSDGSVLLAVGTTSAIFTNPFSINLVSPSGTPAMPTPLFMTTPVFTWSSQAMQFLLKICEKSWASADPESVMQENPHYETDPATPLTSQSFLYPASGVRPLENNRTYYWQVTSIVQTSSGLIEYPSQIGAFTIITQPDPETQQILFILQRILGQDYMNVISQLPGFQPSGRIELDGRTIDLSELEEIASKFEQGSYRMITVDAR